MYWHHIPEMFAIYFMGVWSYEMKIKFKYVLLVYVFVTLLTPLMNWVFQPFSFIFGAILGFPLLIGYYFEKKWGKNEVVK